MAPPNFVPGKHILVDVYGADQLTDVNFIEKTLKAAAQACGATVLNINLHSFGDNQGVTGVALLAESHISIHTWPELEYAAIDVFMCGDCDPQLAVPVFIQQFSPKDVQTRVCERGERIVLGTTKK